MTCINYFNYINMQKLFNYIRKKINKLIFNIFKKENSLIYKL